jgi:hypothetical protein
LSRLLVFVYFVEAGLLLLVAPWSAFWERNYFVTLLPAGREVLLNHFVRGAISGIGLVCLGAALGELGSLLAQRQARPGDDEDHRPRGIGVE